MAHIPQDESQLPIPAFWDWWQSSGREIDPTAMSPLMNQLQEWVTAIDPALSWEFGPGETSEHRLTVTSRGNAEARPAAERWLRAAPKPSDTWEFACRLEPWPELGTMAMDGHPVDPDKTRLRLDIRGDEYRIHLGIYNPDAAALTEEAAANFYFLVLDSLLGEDQVESYVGAVDFLSEEPADGLTLADLAEAVQALSSSRDLDSWALAQWEDDESYPHLAAIRPGLRWLDYPLFDQHHMIQLQYETQDNLLPADMAALESLRNFEDALHDEVGPRICLVAHETRRGTRTFHVYSDSEDQNVSDQIQQLTRKHGAAMTVEQDPGWLRVRRFTG